MFLVDAYTPPRQNATGREPEIDTQGGHGAHIGLGRIGPFRGEAARHLLEAPDDEAEVRRHLAVENTHFRAWSSAYDGRGRIPRRKIARERPGVGQSEQTNSRKD